MKNLILIIFGVNWRTTLLGYIGAIGTAIYPIFTNAGFNIKTDWKNLVVAAFIAIWGRIAKDAKVTGTPEQNK